MSSITSMGNGSFTRIVKQTVPSVPSVPSVKQEGKKERTMTPDIVLVGLVTSGKLGKEDINQLILGKHSEYCTSDKTAAVLLELIDTLESAKKAPKKSSNRGVYVEGFSKTGKTLIIKGGRGPSLFVAVTPSEIEWMLSEGGQKSLSDWLPKLIESAKHPRPYVQK